MASYGVDFTTANRAKAEDALAARKAQFPAVETTYAPSGILPREAVPRMAIGAIIGAATAALAGLGLLCAAWAVTIWQYTYWAEHATDVNLVLLLASLVTGASLVVGAVVAVGQIAAKKVVEAGRDQKNRSTRAAGMFVSVAALAAAFALYLTGHLRRVLNTFAVLDRFDPFGLKSLADADAVLWVLGGIVAIGVGWRHCNRSLAAQKFCEACGEFLGGEELAGVSWEGAERFKTTLQALDVPGVANGLRNHAGSDVKAELFSCPRCGGGFVEATAYFQATWAGDKPGTLAVNWLFASAPITGEQSRLLRQESPKSQSRATSP